MPRALIVNLLPNALLVALLVLMPGCAPKTALDRAAIELSPGQSWHAESTASLMVPGTALAAWSGPEKSSFVVYRTLWIPGGSAEMLAEALGNRLENLPGLKLLVKRTETVAGVAAARVEVVAPGTCDTLAASGLGEPSSPPGKTLIPTRQVTLAFNRPSGAIYLTWHMPEGSYDRIEPEIHNTLQSLRFDSSPESAPSKQ